MNLAPCGVRELFPVVRSIVDEGVSVVFISHKLEDVMSVAHRIVVMRDGASLMLRSITNMRSSQTPTSAGTIRIAAFTATLVPVPNSMGTRSDAATSAYSPHMGLRDSAMKAATPPNAMPASIR